MKETYVFLVKTEVNYLSTIDGDKPSCRPFGAPIIYDDKIYILTSKHKNVSKQIEKNNNACIVAYDGENWLRINCKLIDDSGQCLHASVLGFIHPRTKKEMIFESELPESFLNILEHFKD